MRIFRNDIYRNTREFVKQMDYEFGLPSSTEPSPHPIMQTRKARWWWKWSAEKTQQMCGRPYSQRDVDTAWLRYMETDA
jgi:hypothetical protein